MKARPILFSTPMVLATWEGRKTQTRRLVKPPIPDGCINPIHDADWWMWQRWTPELRKYGYPVSKVGDRMCPYGVPGDLLWAREAWRVARIYNKRPPRELQNLRLWYEADGKAPYYFQGGRYRHARFMPRWASRLTLRITDVRVQRLQDISADDVIDEGIEPDDSGDAAFESSVNRVVYADLWDRINGAGAWDINPWVWALTFEIIKQNVDDYIYSRAAGGPKEAA